MAEIKQTLTGKLKRLQFKFVQNGIAEQVINLADKWDDIYFLLQSLPTTEMLIGLLTVSAFGLIWWHWKKKL